jgi:hypothetical protein
VTVSSDATAGASAGPGGPSPVSQAAVGVAPPPADCFTPRPHTGPGALSALPAGSAWFSPSRRRTMPPVSCPAAPARRSWPRTWRGRGCRRTRAGC